MHSLMAASFPIINQILEDLKLDRHDAATKNTSAKIGVLLYRHTESQPFDGNFNYRCVIGKGNYLEKSTQPKITHSIKAQDSQLTLEPNMWLRLNIWDDR